MLQNWATITFSKLEEGGYNDYVEPVPGSGAAGGMAGPLCLSGPLTGGLFMGSWLLKCCVHRRGK